MSAFITVKCKNASCGKPFAARRADIKRGWGKFCSKSCKAVVQEKQTGKYSDLIHGLRAKRQIKPVDNLSLDLGWSHDGVHPINQRMHQEALMATEEGWDSHKNWTGK